MSCECMSCLYRITAGLKDLLLTSQSPMMVDSLLVEKEGSSREGGSGIVQGRLLSFGTAGSTVGYRLSTRYSSIRERIGKVNSEIALPQIIIQTSAISRKRRIVDLVAAAAGVLARAR